MSRYPGAIWRPWKYLSPSGQPTYYKATNKPIGAVLHIQAGYVGTALEWADAGHFGASWHFSVARTGKVYQFLEFEDGGYQAGIARVREGGGINPDPTWPLWRGWNSNVNNYTLGIEHEGFPGSPLTAEQARASRDLCRWIADELGVPFDRDHFPCHADIALIDRPYDFNFPALREEHYAFMFEEEELSVKDKERLDRLERIFAGWGFHDDEGKPLAGEDAVAFIDAHQRSAYEGIRLLQIAVAGNEAEADKAIAELRGKLAQVENRA